MPEDPKNKREIDKEYLKFVRKHSCLCGVGCIGRVEAHHTNTRGAGGSDYKAIPLCVLHHADIDNLGKKTFQNRYFMSFDKEIIRLLIEYIKE